MSTSSSSIKSHKNKSNWIKNRQSSPVTKKQSSNKSNSPTSSNKLAKYNCQTRLGSGTFGIVIGCNMISSPDASIAIKFLDISKISTDNPDKLYRAIRDFKREKTIHSMLDHPNIIKYIAGINRDNINLDPALNIAPESLNNFFAMEYCDQGTLVSYLLAHNGKPVDRTDIICQIFAGLNYLFQVGVIHLDIKPQNILVASGPKCKIADFGLAKQLKNKNKATIEQGQLKCGTMEYIPYFAENTTYFRDLYAFYCLLYYITTHHHLNSGKPVKTVTKRWSSMDTDSIQHAIFAGTEFSYLANLVQILAKLQGEILSILKKPVIPGIRASKLANIKGVLSFGSNSGSNSNSSANNIITQKLVTQTQRRKLVLNRYDLYAGYYKMLDVELDRLSKTHAKPSIVMPAPMRKKPVTISTELSGTKTKTDIENANNAGVEEPPLTPVKPRY